MKTWIICRRQQIALVCTVLILGCAVISGKAQTPAIIGYLDYSPNSELLVGYGNRLLTIWNADTNQMAIDLSSTVASYGVSDVDWSPDSSRLATVSDDQYVRFWNMTETGFGQLLAEIQPFAMRGIITSVEWNSNGQEVMVSAVLADFNLKAIDVATFQVTEEIFIAGGIERMVWNPNPSLNQLVLADENGPPVISSPANPPAFAPIVVDGYSQIASAMAWNSDGTLLAVGYADGEIRIWNIATNTSLASMTTQNNERIFQLSWSPDDSMIASANGTVEIWNSQNGQFIQSFPETSSAVAFSPDGSQLAFRGTNGTVEIIPAPTTSARVTTNLLALYTFEEGGGTTVADVSGVGTAVNLVIGSPTNASAWGAGYLRFTGGAQGTNGAFAPAGTNKLHTALKAANAVTVEAWGTPANVTQQGPARVVTFSSSIWTRNFTIGQSQTQYDFRLRTTTTDTNGVPGTLTPSNTAAVGLQHIVTTRDTAGSVTIYVNGVSVATSTRMGDFSGWDNAMRFGVGNELSLDRPWRGDVHLVAVYDRALSAAEVTQNFNAGSGDGESSGLRAPENVVVAADDAAREDVISVAPVANAGVDISLTDSDGDGVETVKLDASASTDDVGIVEYLWGDATSDEPLARGVEATLTLPVGTHEVLLIVVDADGQVGVDRVVVRVLTP